MSLNDVVRCNGLATRYPCEHSSPSSHLRSSSSWREPHCERPIPPRRTLAPSSRSPSTPGWKGPRPFNCTAPIRASRSSSPANTTPGRCEITRSAEYETSPKGIVQVNENGLLGPTGRRIDNADRRAKDGHSATLAITVQQFGSLLPINFPNQVVPIFTKLGCNSGGCHGKSGGQNGFRLSLLGFEPTEDYEHLVKEARGRRIFPAAPARSLLLLKATGTLPHGGGKRVDVDSDDYRRLVRWIAQGIPFGKAEDPFVSSIDVYPSQRIMARGGEQQLVVTARYSDGSAEDVSRQVTYEPNEKEMAAVDSNGHVIVNQQPGDVAVMIRYQGKVAVYRAMLPLGAPVDNLPPIKNFIDELVFNKLKAVGMPPSAVCSDSTFLRRVTIDIAGRFPTDKELTAFLADSDSRSATSASIASWTATTTPTISRISGAPPA